MPPRRKFISFSNALKFDPRPAPLAAAENPGIEVDGGTIDRTAAECFPIEANVGKFVLGHLFKELLDRLALERNLVTAHDLAWVC
jgi:hypothetical protein